MQIQNLEAYLERIFMALNLVPQPGQSLNFTQTPILNNFITIDTGFSIDHIAFGDANVGKHKQVTIPKQSGATIPATSANEVMLYCHTTGGTPALYFKGPGKAAGDNGVDFTTANNVEVKGWVQMPGGTIFAWGADSGLGALSIDVTGLFPNQIFNVQLTPRGSSPAYDQFIQFVSYIQPNTIRIYTKHLSTGTGDIGYQWFATGY